MNPNKKALIFFLLITFGLAWATWGIPILLGANVLSPGFGTIQLIGALAPAEAAIFIRAWVTKEGFKNAGLNVAPKRNWRYYVFALTLPVAVVAVIALLAVLLSLGQPDLSLALFFQQTVPPGDEIPAPGLNIWIALILQLMVSSIALSPFILGEEFGWRGYLQPRLAPDRPLFSAVVTGLIWGVWLLPLNLGGYNFPGEPYTGSAIFPVSAVLLSIIFGWLFLRTGSVWAPTLAHAATVWVGVSLTRVLFSETSNLLFTGYYGILGWVPLGAVCLWIVLTGKFKPAEAQPVEVEPAEAPEEKEEETPPLEF